MTEIASRLVRFLDFRRETLLAGVLDLVSFESPSRDKAMLDLLADRLVALYNDCGARVERLINADGGDHLRASWHDGCDPAAPLALVLCHFDTVWPVSTLASMPIHCDGSTARGPGIYDMKASLVMVAEAMTALRSLDLHPPYPIVALLTSDEEIGSPTSRALIEHEASNAAYVLVTEPPLPDGRLKTARKGVGSYTLQVTGRAAHAGVEPEKGASAVLELAHQILRLEALTDLSKGTTVNVGVVRGGSTVNTVPAEACAKVDVRVTELSEAERVDAALHGLTPVVAGTALRVEGGLNRPPMVRTGDTVNLFEQARTIGAELGLDLGEGSTGGGSDGNFTAALGVPTLDGLGCAGDGAHAVHEHILVDSLVERTALLALLLLNLRAPVTTR